MSKADPCVLVRRNELGLVIMGIYVDDIFMLGDKHAMKDAVKGLQKQFKIKINENINDYLSCELKFNEDKSNIWVGQPHLI